MKKIIITCFFFLIIFIVSPVLFISSFNAFAQKAYFQIRSLKEIKMNEIQKQTLDYSCGAASLALLLKNYFEDMYNEQSILSDIVFRLSKQEMEQSMIKGFSMLDLKKTAQRLGYIADGVILPQNAVTALKGPVIILLKKSGNNHFVVLKGATQGHAFIADPAHGHLSMPLYELFTQWNGEALILGYSGFTLPKEHRLAIPQGDAVAPERETVRSLQHIPPP